MCLNKLVVMPWHHGVGFATGYKASVVMGWEKDPMRNEEDDHSSWWVASGVGMHTQPRPAPMLVAHTWYCSTHSNVGR